MSVITQKSARPVADTPPKRREYEAGFWIVALSYLLVMAVGTIPSPLYGLYQHRDGFSTFTITLIFAAYSLGTTTSLFLVGHISDWYGRKRILIPGLAMSAASVLVLLFWRDLPGLYLGRIMGGLAVGAVSGTATAYVAELHATSRPDGSPRRVQLVSAGVSVAGLGIGAVVSGFLAQYVTSPLTVPYLVFLGLLLAAGIGALMTPETRGRAVPAPAYHPQRVSVPPQARGQFFAATAAAAVAFAGFGLFTSLAGFVLVGTLHRTALSLAGATVFTVFASATAMQFITMTWNRRAVLIAGTACLILGVGLVVLAVWLSSPSLVLFLVGGLWTGLGGGAMFKGSLGTVMLISELEHRAEAVAGILLAGYVGLSVPAIGVGVALNAGASTKDTLLGFAIAVAIALAATLPVLLRQSGPKGTLAR
jgi:predicted MFS family arabinose efflux permease